MKKLDGPDFWRSLEEYAETPEFSEMLGREFPRHASEWDGDDNGVSRRRFLELSGASLSLAGLSACVKQPREGLVPYVKQPEELVPSRPLFFATGFTLGGYATGILVESNMGRPTKVEGNPQHPASLGATDLFAQASILSIYDPDRSQTITKLGQIRTWPVFADELSARVQTSRAIGGDGFRLLTPTVTSPTLAAKIGELLAILPKARWHQWEPAGRDAVRAGARVFCTAGTAEKLARCRELGAEVAINYRDEDFVEWARAATDGRGVDVILDNMGAKYLPRNVAALAAGGRLVVIGLQGGRKGELDLGALLTKRASVTATSLRARPAAEKARIVAEVVANVWPGVADGSVRPVVDRVLRLSEAAAAHRLVEDGGHIGKVLLAVR